MHISLCLNHVKRRALSYKGRSPPALDERVRDEATRALRGHRPCAENKLCVVTTPSRVTTRACPKETRAMIHHFVSFEMRLSDVKIIIIFPWEEKLFRFA